MLVLYNTNIYIPLIDWLIDITAVGEIPPLSSLNKMTNKIDKILEGTAKRILSQDRELSLKSYKWDVPTDLKEISKSDINRFQTFIGIGRWKSGNIEKETKFVCIAQRGELIYLEPSIVEILYNSLKEKTKW